MSFLRLAIILFSTGVTLLRAGGIGIVSEGVKGLLYGKILKIEVPYEASEDGLVHVNIRVLSPNDSAV
ncbi:MAG: hypothetical protein ABIL05_05315, partial [candidate division WOR-3 bacterium]